jgi:diguanylate cyclase (GGDEF)-like protein
MTVTNTALRIDALRRLPRAGEAFYEISDMDTARRIGGVLWIFSGLVVAVMLPVWPPTGRIGVGGWAVVGGVVLLSLVSGVLLLRRPELVPPNALLAMSYLALALLVLLVWVGGEPYAPLFMVPTVYVAAVHPPRRVALVFVAVAVGSAAPLLYDGWNSEVAAETVSRLLLWYSIGLVAMLFSASVRLDRLTLMAGEQEASALARRDALTGLGNRRAFDEALERVVAGARRSDRPLSLVIADIEHFKAINDSYGHLEGDRCLREVAAVLAATVRPSDSCFRWGGDEFALILPSTDAEQAGAVVQRVTRALEAEVSPPGSHPLRLRYGIAEIRPEMTGQELVAAADLALLSARPTGARLH